MDVGIIFVLASTMFIKKSCSQTLSISPQCFSNGDTLTLICDTNDVSDVISFVLNGGNQGGCLANSGNCGAGITQSGTTTRKTISPFNDLLHSGSWTCTYGSLASVPKSIAENPCVETTEGITEGTTTPIPTTSSIPTPTTIPTTTPFTPSQKCFGFIKIKSCLYPIIVIVVIVLLVLAIGGVIYWKRNQKKTFRQKKKHSATDTEKQENTNDAFELPNTATDMDHNM